MGEAKWSDIVLGKKIGQGGFGIVYHGTWKGRTVAVKKLFCEEMEVREYESFQMEIEIMRFLFLLILMKKVLKRSLLSNARK